MTTPPQLRMYASDLPDDLIRATALVSSFRVRRSSARRNLRVRRYRDGRAACVLGTPLLTGLLLFLSPGFELAAQRHRVLLQPDFVLNGVGRNVDTVAFWEAERPDQSLMFVTAKNSSLVEVWPFPFQNSNQAPPIRHESFDRGQVNGVVVDQVQDLLYVSIGEPSAAVSVFSLPDRSFVRVMLDNILLGEEPGIDHYLDGDRSWIYVTSDNRRQVYVLDTNNDAVVLTRNIGRESETLLADEFHEVVYIPDENGRTGIYAYTRELKTYQRNGRTSFGGGLFQDDAEGILLYRCEDDARDTGEGFIVVADQRRALSDFEFFDRVSWDYLGTLQLAGTNNTDGIASSQESLPGYPLGVFAAVDDDTRTVGIGWDKVLAAMGLECND